MRAVEVPIYDFNTHSRSGKTQHVEPADVVIMEGILVLHIPEVRELFNMKIFVVSLCFETYHSICKIGVSFAELTMGNIICNALNFNGIFLLILRIRMISF